jgi:heptosyltransferase-2
MTPHRAILLRTPSWLGDAVLATAVVRRIAEVAPDAPLVVLARERVKELYVNLSAVRYLLVEPPGVVPSAAPALAALVRRLSRERVRLGIVLTDSWLPVAMARLAGIKQVFAFRGGARDLLVPHAVRRTPGHLLDQYAALLEAAGLAGSPLTPHLVATADDTRRAADLLGALSLSGDGPLCVLAPGGAFGVTKRWPLSHVADLAARLAGQGVRVLLVGSDSERAFCDQVTAHAGRGVTHVAGRTGLRELMGLCAQAGLVIGNDSGVVHLAAALGTPTIGLYGSTDPAWTAPVSREHLSIADQPACAPCFQKTCPIDVACLARIDPERVLARALERLASGGRRVLSEANGRSQSAARTVEHALSHASLQVRHGSAGGGHAAWER